MINWTSASYTCECGTVVTVKGAATPQEAQSAMEARPDLHSHE